MHSYFIWDHYLFLTNTRSVRDVFGECTKRDDSFLGEAIICIAIVLVINNYNLLDKNLLYNVMVFCMEAGAKFLYPSLHVILNFVFVKNIYRGWTK